MTSPSAVNLEPSPSFHERVVCLTMRKTAVPLFQRKLSYTARNGKRPPDPPRITLIVCDTDERSADFLYIVRCRSRPRIGTILI